MESKKNCEGHNESLSLYKERIRQSEEINNLYERCGDILQDFYKLQGDYFGDGRNEGYDYFTAIHDSVSTFRDEFSHMRAQGLEELEELEESVKELEEGIEELEEGIEEGHDWEILYDFGEVLKRIFFIQRELAYMRAQRLEEVATQLLEKCESYEQRGKGTTIPPREARKQRKKEISQIRREAVNERWRKERANAEASTPAESYKAANAVSVQSQNIVQGSARKTLRKTYRPTHAQVAAYMQNRLGVRENVAEFEAAKFRDHYDALNWENKGTPIVDWEACARNWVRRAAEYKGRGIFEEQERPKEPQAPKEKETRGENTAREDLVYTYAEKVFFDEFSDALGANARKISEMMNANDFTHDWLGGIAADVDRYIMVDVAKYFASRMKRGDYTGPLGADVRSAEEAIKNRNFPNGWRGRFFRNVSRYL